MGLEEKNACNSHVPVQPIDIVRYEEKLALLVPHLFLFPVFEQENVNKI